MSETKHSPVMDLIMKQPYIWNDQPASPSAEGPSETAAPAGSLRCDGVVGLRSERVTSLIERWAKHAGQWKTDADNHRRSKDPAAKISAERCDGRAAIYAACIEDLRAEMEAETVRQPEPNIASETAPHQPTQ